MASWHLNFHFQTFTIMTFVWLTRVKASAGIDLFYEVMQFIKYWWLMIFRFPYQSFGKKGYKRWFLCGRQPVRYWKKRQAQYFPDISRIFLGYCCNLLELLHAPARETGSKTVIFQGREINQYWLSGKIPNNLNSISGEFSQSSKNSTEQSIWAVCGVLCRQSEGILSKSVKLDIGVSFDSP